MGSFDVYCLICGAPFFAYPVVENIKLLKKYLDSGKYHGVEPDGTWENADWVVDYLKDKCDMSENDYTKLINSITQLNKHDWLKNAIAITKDDTISVKYHDATTFYINGKKNKQVEVPFNKKHPHIYCMHKSCHDLLKKNNYDVNFEAIDVDFLKIISSYRYNSFDMSYGDITKYQGQFFYTPLAYLEKPYLLLDPMKNNENASRILKLKFPLNKLNGTTNKKNILKIRPSLSESATLFAIGTKKKGNDSN